MRRVCLLVAFVACLPPPAVDSSKPGQGAATRVDKRVVVVSSRPSGYYHITTAGDGSITTVFHVLQNGRGPHVEAALTLGSDWTIASFSARGKHTMGTRVDETFTRRGNRVSWKSEEESGDQQLTSSAFFIPIADGPITPYLVPAALKAGGRIALLPGGEARVDRVADFAVTGPGGAVKHLVGYAVSGLGLTATYSWFDADGSWFGDVSSYESFVPEGFESAIEPLVKKQDELDRARDAKLAQLHATRPVSGVAFTNARVLDVERGVWIANQTVIVIGDKIHTVGKTGSVKIPDDIDPISVEGMGIMPGLIDMHSHTSSVDGILDIAAGVTTVRDVGNDPDQLDDMLKRFDEGTAIGPHIVRMGFIEGRGEKAAAAKVTAETLEEAKAAVEFYAKRGYEGIKIYNSIKTELVPYLAAEAHNREMLVIGHVPVHMLANEAVLAGYDGIEHVNMLFLNFFATKDTDTRDTTRFTLVGEKAADFALDGKPALELLELLRQRKTTITPTLSAFEDLFVGEQGKITPGLEQIVERMPVQTARGFTTGGLPMDAEKRALYARSWEKLLAMVKALWQAKVTTVLGTDHIGGVMLHHEMELFVRAGIPAKDVVRMATLDSAKAMKLDKKIGTITAGKRADLVVVEADPLVDIKAMRRTVYTMRGGVLYRADALYNAVNVKP